MSSPKMTRMLGFSALFGMFFSFAVGSVFGLEGIDALPVALHVDHEPALGSSRSQRLIQLADARAAVVSPFASGVGVMHQPQQAGAAPSRRPLEHLQVAIGVAEREQRAA